MCTACAHEKVTGAQFAASVSRVASAAARVSKCAIVMCGVKSPCLRWSSQKGSASCSAVCSSCSRAVSEADDGWQ
eukprot:1117516-Prymnesium_polylepis.2